ncbi:MAG TPA: hypothetical protein VF618_20015 [Thermoanaerobaculia bacterium]
MSKRRLMAALVTIAVLALSTPATAAPRSGENGWSRFAKLIKRLLQPGATGAEISVPKP